MKARHKVLLEKSVSAALAAIEIYNKPNFSYRNESFCILISNAWELLLKAKLVKDNKNKLSCLFIKRPNGTYKKNSDGIPITIDILKTAEILKINDSLKENIKKVVEIRNSAIHLTFDDDSNYIVYTVGAATLKNFSTFIKLWFKIDLTKFDFYILPLGFNYQFKTFEAINVKTLPKEIKSIFKGIKDLKSYCIDDDYDLICEIKVQLINSKIGNDDTHKIKIDNNDENAVVGLIKNVTLTDSYPFTYHQILNKIRSKFPDIKVSIITSEIQKLKGNKMYSAYNFRNKSHEEKYKISGILTAGTPAIYNSECIKYLSEFFKSKTNDEYNASLYDLPIFTTSS